MIKRLQKALPKDTAAYIESPQNRRYYSKFTSSNGFLFVTEKTALFYTDFRYITAAKNQVCEQIEVRLLDKNRYEILAELTKKEGIKTLLIEENYLSYASAKSMEKQISPCKIAEEGRDYSFTFRQIKSEWEIENIRKAQKIADSGFDFLCNLIFERKTDLSEREAASRLEFFMKLEGAEDVAFSTIAAFGENSALPHATPTERKIKNGDALLFDYGAKINGYCSDITRTVFFESVLDEQKKVYDIVLAAQKKALAEIRAGKTGSEIDAVARDCISSAGYGNFFGHALGHSVGLDIHESPNFSPAEKVIISENTVITVEPGIYLENKFGVRIEDLVIVKKGGCENLTASPKELIIIE